MKVVIEKMVSEVLESNMKMFLKIVSKYYFVTSMSKNWSMT